LVQLSLFKHFAAKPVQFAMREVKSEIGDVVKLIREDFTSAVAETRAELSQIKHCIDDEYGDIQYGRDKEAAKETVAETGLQHEVWLFASAVNADSGPRRYAQRYEIFSVSLVLALVMIDIVTSVRELDVSGTWPVELFELISYAFFTLEYIVRLWSCTAAVKYSRYGVALGRLRWACGGLPLLDLLVLFAFYMQQILVVFSPDIDDSELASFQVLRMFRLLRICSLMKLERKANAFKAVYTVLQKESQGLIATLVAAVVLVIMFAAMMFNLENEAQPEAYSDIPASMWWSVTALTSVGYGDTVPETPAGKVLGCFVCVFGAGLIALPTGILSMGFVEEYKTVDIVEDEVLEQLENEESKLQALTTEVSSLLAEVEEIERNQEEAFATLQRLFPEASAQAFATQGLFQSNHSELQKAGTFDDLLEPADEGGPVPTEIDLASLRRSVQRKLYALRLATSRSLVWPPLSEGT